MARKRTGILRLPSGRFRIRWSDSSGTRRSETFASEATARAGLRRHQVAVDSVRSGLVQERAHTTLREAAPPWLAHRPPARVRDNRMHLDTHILPALGDLRLAAITVDVVQGFLRELERKAPGRPHENRPGAKLAPATIRNVLVTLRKLLADHGFHIRVPYKIGDSGYGWIQTPEGVTRFLSECRGWFQVAAGLGVYAGLRKGEVAGLRRDALDFDRQLIRVDHSYDGPTKSRKVRWVPLAPALASLLRPWLLATRGELVVMVDGKAITPKTKLDRPMERACKRAGIPRVTFHQLRHTAASHLALRNPLPIVGAILGHVDPKTTARYAHLDSESLARSTRVHLDFSPPSGEVVALPIALVP